MNPAEPTRDGRIARSVKQNAQMPQTGIITRVREHEEPNDPWNYHVDVELTPGNYERKVPFAVPMPGLAAPPRGNDHPDGPDLALVQYFQDDEVQRPVVTNILYNNEDRPPIGDAGIVRLNRGDMYFEMADDGSYARLSQKSGDEATPDLVIEMDDTGAIKLGTPGGDMQPIARQGDAVEVNGNTGQITGGSSDVEST